MTMVNEKKRLIRVRSQTRTPKFRRTQYYHKKKLKDVWRRPRGLQNKQRRHYRAKGAHPQPGYGSPAAVRGLHPSGYEEVLVFNPSELADLSPELQAVRIGGTVGGKKRDAIQKRALELGLRVLNSKYVALPEEEMDDEVEEDE